MSNTLDIKWYDQIDDLLEHYAEKVITTDGNIYYRLSNWFQVDGSNFKMHRKLPEDLCIFLTKSGLGGDNPKPIKPES